MDLVDDGGDARGDLVGRVDGDVVRADHQHDDLRRHAFEFAMTQAPEDVFGAVPTVAQIHDSAAAEAAEESIPHLRRGASPANLIAARIAAPEMHDGIAEHDDIRLTLAHQRDGGGV